MTERETVPDWWADEYRPRQERCRKRILAYLSRHGEGTIWEFSLANYGRREVESALAALVSSGAILAEEVEERVCHNASRTIVRRYYRLPGQPARLGEKERAS